MPKVLTTVYQASKSSGKITRNAAEKLAACLGSTHHELEISKAVDLYIKLFDKANDGPFFILGEGRSYFAEYSGTFTFAEYLDVCQP